MKLKLSVFACFLLIFSCKQNEEKSKILELNVGVHAWPGSGPVYIAQEKGFFTKNGLKVNIQKIESFDTKRAALIGGTIDIDIANTMDQLLIYREANFGADIIAVSDQSTGGDGIVCKEGINSIADLKGKTVAFAEASPSDFYLRYVLKKNNINLTDIKLNPVADPSIAGQAMISKKVDAAVTYEPFLSQADNETGIKLLSSTKDYPTLIPGLLIADEVKIRNNSEAYKRFLDAWFEAADFYYSNTNEAQEIISKGMGMDLKEVKDILSVVEIQTRPKNALLLDPKTEDDLLELLSEIAIFWIESGYIKKDIKGVDMIDEELITGKYATVKK